MTEEIRQVQGKWVVTWVNPQKPIDKLDETGNTSQRKKEAGGSAESECKKSVHVSRLWLCPALGLQFPGTWAWTNAPSGHSP